MKKTISLCMLFLLLLTGCSMTTGIDTLLTPPNLSTQQEHIYNALKNYTGPNISLKYPKSGENLSAFIVSDIDNDSDEEAIVFYKKNTIKTEDNSLRINILDQTNSEWRSVYDHAADGNEVEQVSITKLGENDRVNIIVGYSLINQSEKVVSIYDYSDNTLNTTFENNYYSVFDVADLNGDDKNELFIALNQSASRNAAANVFYLRNDGNYLRSALSLNENYTDYQNPVYGLLDDGSKAIYLDAAAGNGVIATEVMAVDKENNLKSVFSPNIKKEETMRPSAYHCKDINGDGTVEIPVPSPCPGESKTDENAIYLTDWYEIKEKKLAKKYLGYLSITDGYSFIIPEEWYNHVTIQDNPAGNEIKICRYDDNPEEISEILSITTVSESDKSTKLWNDGYKLLHSKGEKMFFVKINDDDDDFVKSPAEIMLKFKFED